jgi:acetyl-CoA carboxylase carboxyl transferase subunit alpha
MVSYLEFEKPVAALDARIKELRATAVEGDLDISAEIGSWSARAPTCWPARTRR